MVVVAVVVVVYLHEKASSSRDETANVNFFYDDIVQVLQNTKLTVQLSGSLQKTIYHDKIRLAVEFENNNEYLML